MNSLQSDPWQVDEAAYPHDGPLDEQLRFLLQYAVLAPSGHNTQPWRFACDDGLVRLHADRTRSLPIVDPDDRELVISCGAALFNLRVAMDRFGFAADVAFRIGSDDPSLLAVVRPRPADGRAFGDDLFPAIRTRRTNRRAFGSGQVVEALKSRLVDAAAREDVYLWLTEDPGQKQKLAELVARGDVIQMASSPFRDELASWVRRGHGSTRDGMPGYAFGVSEKLDFITPVAAFAIRRFNMGKSQAAKDSELAEGSPVLAVISTAGDGIADWLRAGQGLAHVLLAAEAGGLSASYLNQPIELPELRPQVASIVGEHVPQLLLRLGIGERGQSPTPRRSVDQVLDS